MINFNNVKRGDILRHIQSNNSYVVEKITSNNSPVLVGIVIATNPAEWTKICKECGKEE